MIKSTNFDRATNPHPNPNGFNPQNTNPVEADQLALSIIGGNHFKTQTD